MKYSVTAAAAALLSAAVFAGAGTALDPARVEVTGVADRDPLSYRAGETIIFEIQTDYGGQKAEGDYFLAWERSGDDGRTERGRERVSARPLVLRTSLDRPGFVRITATLLDAGGKPLPTRNNWGQPMNCGFEGGAGVEPDKLAGLPEIADFDAFWRRQKARLAAVPLKYRLEQQTSSLKNVTVYAATVDCAGPRPVTGYLTVPAGARKRSLPVRAVFAGYGVEKQNPPQQGPEDCIVFHVNAHGFELNRDADYYAGFARAIESNGFSYAFDPKQNADPERAYFNGMALRVLRSLEFLKALPEWDGVRLEVAGGSQGGLQAIWGAGLDPDVTGCKADIPWCCDLAGAAKLGRLNGWHPEYRRPLDYYDAVNHAKRIRCPVEITRAGLGDYTCAPSGVAILYNSIESPKKITWVQGSTHGYVPKNPQRIVREK